MFVRPFFYQKCVRFDPDLIKNSLSRFVTLSDILRFHAKSIIDGFWKDFELSRHETYERYLLLTQEVPSGPPLPCGCNLV